VTGSGSETGQLTAGLVDELQLILYPTVVGSGLRMLPEQRLDP
jgi:hypothetical protein